MGSFVKNKKLQVAQRKIKSARYKEDRNYVTWYSQALAFLFCKIDHFGQ